MTRTSHQRFWRSRGWEDGLLLLHCRWTPEGFIDRHHVKSRRQRIVYHPKNPCILAKKGVWSQWNRGATRNELTEHNELEASQDSESELPATSQSESDQFKSEQESEHSSRPGSATGSEHVVSKVAPRSVFKFCRSS
jgi:hypothetical protein